MTAMVLITAVCVVILARAVHHEHQLRRRHRDTHTILRELQRREQER